MTNQSFPGAHSNMWVVFPFLSNFMITSEFSVQLQHIVRSFSFQRLNSLNERTFVRDKNWVKPRWVAEEKGVNWIVFAEQVIKSGKSESFKSDLVWVVLILAAFERLVLVQSWTRKKRVKKNFWTTSFIMKLWSNWLTRNVLHLTPGAWSGVPYPLLRNQGLFEKPSIK